jgi:hypothetical protein
MEAHALVHHELNLSSVPVGTVTIDRDRLDGKFPEVLIGNEKGIAVASKL